MIRMPRAVLGSTGFYLIFLPTWITYKKISRTYQQVHLWVPIVGSAVPTMVHAHPTKNTVTSLSSMLWIGHSIFQWGLPKEKSKQRLKHTFLMRPPLWGPLDDLIN